LLYGEGYTIRGVQRLLKEQGLRFVQSVWQPGAPQPTHRPSEETDDSVEASEATEHGGEERADRSEAAGDGAVSSRATPQATGLPREQLLKLHAALHELTECRKLLHAALNERS
jgi:hypothetical protein